MSFDVNWDTEKYKEDHESEEHWQLRKAFMDRWKQDYPEERLVCLARVFANMEFMGCRYPPEIMHEVAGMSHEIVQSYRKARKNKLQRTFVAASTAAEDRARGVKREGGVITSAPPAKSNKISFIPSGQKIESDKSDSEVETNTPIESNGKNQETTKSDIKSDNEYLNEMMAVKCLDVRNFTESMYQTEFGRMVLLIRPWASKLSNLISSCQVCGLNTQSVYERGCFKFTINGKLVAQATGDCRADAKSIVEMMAWNRLRENCVSVLFKEQWIAQGDARISVSDVSASGKAQDMFGSPIESNVAAKMMKLMGWKGGALGVDAQGIEEPIKPNMRMVNRAGLGSTSADIRAMRRAAQELMQRYIASDTLDVDLVFSTDFNKDERAALHQVAQKSGLASKSYGSDKDRFLVVKKKLNPFALVSAVIEKGGVTPKYRVFIPAAMRRNGR